MPPIRTLSRSLARVAALAATLASAAPAAGQEFLLRAFGDSITEGYGDVSSFNGYPARLERRLRQAGYDVFVTEHGVGGETTLQGLSRIDDVLALGGDFLLLMEGTNDISQRVSLETIGFNLDEMASRAEALGFIAVHATVIPRIPTAPVDGDNARTSALATDLLELGAERFRAVADVFHTFESLPNLYEDYYYDDDTVPDPVGHPNNAGYIVIAGVFFETMGPLLDGPQLNIVAPGSPAAPGAQLEFAVVTSNDIARVEWTFGDGGFAVSTVPPEFAVPYIFAQPGTYSVTATGFAPSGGVVADSLAFAVAGAAPPWSTRTVLVPAVSSAGASDVVSDLRLANLTAAGALADVSFLADIRYDETPPTLRLFLPPGGAELDDVLPGLFGIDGGRGGLVVDLQSTLNSASLSAEALLRSADDGDGSAGCESGALAESDWTASPQQISDFALAVTEKATVHLVNPGALAGSVRLDLYDGVNGFVGSGLFDLAAGASRQRELGDLFRGLGSRPQPFTAYFSSSGIPYSAYAVVSGAADTVRCLAAAP
jgi:lysophospholipase L1-like esterase